MDTRPRVILLIPPAREFDRGIRRGIVQYSHTHGNWIFYEEAPGYLHGLNPRQRLRHMRQWNADGMIVLQGRLGNVKSLHLPTVVSIGTRKLGKHFSQLVCDNERIGQMGAETLLALGVRHFAYCGLRGLEFSDVRRAAFVDAIRRAGYPTRTYAAPIQRLGESWYTEEQHLARWLSGLPKPIGLMACNDDRARVVTEVCHLRNINIPDEIAILGVDNDEQVCSSANPPLSSIALATERAGYEAAALLARLMSSPRTPVQTIVVRPTHVVSRPSTDILAIDDPAIVRALRFIRANSNTSVQVHDVARVAGLSRRALQDRFRHYLGRAPLDEIHRCRIDRITRLLVETNLPVSEIAEASGFEADAHFARFFSRHTGTTPRAYRQTHRTTG